ncbi:MAG TPA: phosphoribosylanthranilate isomerase [Cyclobacteriaceae bacterium]|nr:phosphoribosylanthranilate isomerase [Cyclobacteriaceae bacterium]HRF34943.1 phosphoribosylanthranilate isomerase [Cyclobacteriaceae bacterium]
MNIRNVIRLKICGMRDVANMLDVAALGPDYMGFIFYELSPRFVGKQFSIPSDFPESIKRVGVFVNEDSDVVLDLIQKHRLDFVQLHGDEAVSYSEKLKAHNVGIFKVFRVDEKFDFTRTEQFENLSDYFLFDTKGNHYGGNAVKFNWNLLQQYKGSVPFFLSGGISAKDAELTEFYHDKWYGVDVNSGVEIKPGLKDKTKVKNMVQLLNLPINK